MILLLAYWIATTVYGVYWLIKHPSSTRGDDEEYFTLMEATAHIVPAGLFAWAIVPMLLLSKIRFKRNKWN